jgi:hypothetical protein
LEQKDFLLREIEKISIVLRVILNSLLGRKESMAITPENQFKKTRDLLFKEINFELDKCLAMNEDDLKAYLTSYKGINTGNLELLAEIIFKLGINNQDKNNNIYLRKALQLYKICNEKDKTFSIERENKIKEIKNMEPENE